MNIQDVKITSQLYRLLMQKGLSEDAIDLEYSIKRQCSVQEKNGWLFDEHGAMHLQQRVNDDLRKAEQEVHKTFCISKRYN